ncbi:duboraya isoform X2 [Centropristis striata]|uniref:duboraya isoform X2 n=1 Tax=Centropristis striata TaxID=184440 RepID=UPI0027E0FD16|nr:duboraya isoform X2 [Centropristis striata]
MEEQATSRRSVAELAGKFKGSAHPHDAAGNETQEKPVRRRPPRSLQLTKPHGDDQEPPGVTSPLPAKAKRNSALIEKLQANLALSPTTMLPSPKSPGFRLLPPAFTPTPPGPDPVSTVTTSSTVTPTSPVTAVTPSTEEEGPSSFETPPTAAEGSILSNSSIKGRARHSLRRRPPSRRNRKSSSGDEVGAAIEGVDASLSSPTDPEEKTTGEGGEKEAGEEVCKKESEIDESEDKTLTCPEKNESHQEDESKISVENREEDEEKKEGSVGGDEGDRATSGRKEEEEEKEKNAEKQKEDLTEGATNTDSKEEENTEETTS